MTLLAIRNRFWLMGLAAFGLSLASGPEEARACGGNAFIGSVCVFAGNFCPVGTIEANGAQLPIPTNVNLYSIIGTTYGGDGTSNFLLPDLRGREILSIGQAPGMELFRQGQVVGQNSVALGQNNMPAHSHSVNLDGQLEVLSAFAASQGPPDSRDPAQSLYAISQASTAYAEMADTNLAPDLIDTKIYLPGGTTGTAGHLVPEALETISPQLGMTLCIVTDGTYPTSEGERK